MHHVSISNKPTRCSWAVTFITALFDYSICFGCFLHPSSGVQLYMQPLAQVHIGWPPSYVAEYKLVIKVTAQLHRVGLFDIVLWLAMSLKYIINLLKIFCGTQPNHELLYNWQSSTAYLCCLWDKTQFSLPQTKCQQSGYIARIAHWLYGTSCPKISAR